MAGLPFFHPAGPRRNGATLPPGRKVDPRDPLGVAPLFALLSPEARARLRKKLQQRSLPDGKALFTTGEPADALYVVQQGRFRVFVRDHYNQERVLQFVGPGEVLGEASFMADVPHVSSAVAVEPSQVWRVVRADFEALLSEDQEVLHYLASIIAKRQAQANTRLAAESAPEEARAERGYVTAVFSPRGGAGTTTLAVNLGVALAERHPDEVVLLDLAVPFGHALSYLWLTPKGVLAQAPANSLRQLDRRGLDYYVVPHRSSLRIFPAATRADEGQRITADQIRAAVSLLRRHFGYVILDLPHEFSDVTLTGFELAQRLLVLASPDLTSLRDAVECQRVFTELLHLPEEKPHYFLNHPHPYAGAPVADFAAATGVPWEEIPFGGDSPALAAMRGESLVSTRPGNPVAKLATRLSETVVREAHEAALLAGTG